jgi:hypothetical protein
MAGQGQVQEYEDEIVLEEESEGTRSQKKRSVAVVTAHPWRESRRSRAERLLKDDTNSSRIII